MPHTVTRVHALYRFEAYRNNNFLGAIHARDFSHAYLIASNRYGAGITVRF